MSPATSVGSGSPGPAVGRGVGARSGRRAGRGRRGRASAPASGRGCPSAASRRPQRLAERSAPDDLARRGHDDAPELGERRPGRLQVDRLQVEERVADRDDDEVAPDDRCCRTCSTA